jgi:hypothetical protein
MMACSRNLSKHLENCYKTKINKEMFQHDFQNFCKSNDFFLPKKKVIKYSLLIFIFHICAKFQTKKKKKPSRHTCIWMFPITLSDFQLHEFLHMSIPWS